MAVQKNIVLHKARQINSEFELTQTLHGWALWVTVGLSVLFQKKNDCEI